MATQQGLLSAVTKDSTGIGASTPIFVEIDDTKTVAQLLGDAAAYAGVIQGLTQGNVVQYKAEVIVPITPGSAALGKIENGSLYNFNNATDRYAQDVWVPDINPAILTSTGQIDLTNANVIAFITFMTTAQVVITAVTKGLRALTTLRDALEAFRTVRRKRQAKSRVTP